jgi:hypothetical protein
MSAGRSRRQVEPIGLTSGNWFGTARACRATASATSRGRISVRRRPRRVILWITAAIRRRVVEQVGAEGADEGFEFIAGHLVQGVRGFGRPAGLAGPRAVPVHAQRQPNQPAGGFALVADGVAGPQVGAQCEAGFGQALAQDGASGPAVPAVPHFREVVGPPADGLDALPEVQRDGLPGRPVGAEVGGFGEEFVGRRLGEHHRAPPTRAVGFEM